MQSFAQKAFPFKFPIWVPSREFGFQVVILQFQNEQF